MQNTKSLTAGRQALHSFFQHRMFWTALLMATWTQHRSHHCNLQGALSRQLFIQKAQDAMTGCVLSPDL